MKIKFEPADGWVGIYRKRVDTKSADVRFRYYLCLVPFFPIIWETPRWIDKEMSSLASRIALLSLTIAGLALAVWHVALTRRLDRVRFPDQVPDQVPVASATQVSSNHPGQFYATLSAPGLPSSFDEPVFSFSGSKLAVNSLGASITNMVPSSSQDWREALRLATNAIVRPRTELDNWTNAIWGDANGDQTEDFNHWRCRVLNHRPQEK